MRLELLVMCEAAALSRFFTLIASHAKEVQEIRLTPAAEQGVGRLTVTVDGGGNEKDLWAALIRDSAVREAMVIRQPEIPHL